MWTKEGNKFDKGLLIDGSKIMFWVYKRDAIAFLKKHGISTKNTVECHTRFCDGWTVFGDLGQGYLSKDWWVKHEVS